MSSYAAFHIQSSDVMSIEALCLDWLRRMHKSSQIRISTGGYPHHPHDFALNQKPTWLAIAKGTVVSGWSAVHYNSFLDSADWGMGISQQLQCRVVRLELQTVSDSYQIDVWEASTRLRSELCSVRHAEAVRSISVQDGMIEQQAGEPFAFELPALGRALSQEDPDVSEPFYYFGWDEAMAFCEGLALPVAASRYDGEWIRIRAKCKRWG